MEQFLTLPESFYKWEKTKPNATYLRQPFGSEWLEYSWKEVGDQARRMVSALQAMGLKPGDHIGLVSKNCAHWIIADLAIMMGGFVSVPFFPNLTAGQLKQVLTHSEVKVAFVGKLDEWESIKTGVPEHVKMIRFPHYPGNAEVKEGLEWNKLIEQYEPAEQVATPSHDDLFTIIYTSGTTGTPKGVMLPYKSPAMILESERKHGFLNIYESDENRYFSYLPLNHIAERMIVESASIYTGGTVSFAESIDTFAQNLADTRPTVFMAVPRIWTKFQMGILAKMPQKRLNLLLSIPGISSVIKKKIQKALGLDNANVTLTGAAPIPVSLIKFFEKLGINVQEVYGMTENSAGCTIMRRDNVKYGTVGQPLPEAEVRIDEETGEILTRAPWLMTGYYKAEEKTAEILKDGWLYTGDKGEMDADGFLYIKGRVKDTFKTSKGKYIVPGPIEWKFAKNNLIEQICVVGNGVPQPIALVVLSEIAQSLSKIEIEESLSKSLHIVNDKLAAYEKVKRLVIVHETWDVNNKILTPTLKVKRNLVDELYGPSYEKWYEQPAPVIWAEPVMSVSQSSEDIAMN